LHRVFGEFRLVVSRYKNFLAILELVSAKLDVRLFDAKGFDPHPARAACGPALQGAG
jgi:hypothetical protein